ncbi:hypothetical protein JCM10212_006286 [Sporobolomyces blumeae]
MTGVSSPFPPPPAGPAAAATASPTDPVDLRRGSLRDITSVVFGSPNTLPGPSPSHFFPSVPKARRDQQRAARLAASPPPPPHDRVHEAYHAPHAGSARTADGSDQMDVVSSPSAASTEDDSEAEMRRRAAKRELASHGPFPSAASPFPPRSNPSSLREGSSTSGTPTLKSVGAGGSQGTKRRHRETASRTGWDAASELVRIEREKEKVIDQWGTGHTGAIAGRDSANGDMRHREYSAGGKVRGGDAPSSPSAARESQDEGRARFSMAESHASSPQDVEMNGPDGDDDDDEVDDDAASVATFRTGASAKSKGKAKSSAAEKEPAKKRSRTLTTPAQTAVLNALLAKTRFPSTETREEVGAQIGMSARRVQIWFQNRRQSQKRQRDRDVQEATTASIATNASSHSLPLGHGVPVHPHYPYGPPTVDPYAAHRYPHHGQGLAQAQHARLAAPNGALIFAPDRTASHTSLHQLQPPRGELSRQTSIDSLASRASFVSAQSAAPSAHVNGVRREDGHGPLASDGRYAHPFASLAFPNVQGRSVQPPTTYHPHSTAMPVDASAQFPSKLYFPHVSRQSSAGHIGAPPSRVRAESHVSVASAGPDVKLPSLSALLNAPTPPPRQSQEESSGRSTPTHQQPGFSEPSYASASHTTPRPVEPAPSPAPAQPRQQPFPRAVFSPPPSSSFERLRISGPMFPGPQPEPTPPASSASLFAFNPPPLPSAQPEPVHVARESPPLDVLDVAMETMAYRPAGRSLPPRSTLPPLRSVFGESPFPTKIRGGAKTEADKALMAPILPSTSSSSTTLKGGSGGPPRLAPISTFPISFSLPSDPLSPASRPGPTLPTSPAVPYLSPSTRASTMSDTSTAQTHSSVASFDFGHHVPVGSHRDRYYQSNAGGSGGWPSIVGTGGGGPASIGGSGSSPRHRSSVGSSSRTSISSDPHDK